MAEVAEDAGPSDKRRTVLSGNHAYTCEENILAAEAAGSVCDERLGATAKPTIAPRDSAVRKEAFN
jgi:hypothetical protein